MDELIAKVEGGVPSIACMCAIGLAFIMSPRVVLLCLSALCGTCHFSNVAPTYTTPVEEWFLALDHASKVALAMVVLLVMYDGWWCYVTSIVLCATLTILTQDLSSWLQHVAPQLVAALGDDAKLQYAMAAAVALAALLVGLPLASYFQLQYFLLNVIFTAGAAYPLNGVQGVLVHAASMVLPAVPESVEEQLSTMRRELDEMKSRLTEPPQSTPSAPAA